MSDDNTDGNEDRVRVGVVVSEVGSIRSVTIVFNALQQWDDGLCH